jgi:DNA polymerase-3 subunit epsilon
LNLPLDAQVVIVDCQTNGSSPANHQMVELGWSVCSAANSDLVRTSLIGLKEGQTIPGRILSLIGIDAEELIGAAKESEVMSAFKSSLPPQPIFVSHYARFERGFLQDYLDFNESPIICTFEIARRLYPDLPSRSIRAVSGYLGFNIGEAKRSSHHIEATFFIWQKLVEKLAGIGIRDFQTLAEWLKVPPVKRGKKSYALATNIRLNMPNLPGIYKMLGHDGSVLYVGKATSLKSRVNSYFRGQKTKGSRINELVSQIADIDVTVANSPFEAALLEADAIKSYNPPYNRAQKAGNRAIGYANTQMQPSVNLERYGPFSSLRFIESIYQLKAAVEDSSLFPLSEFEVDAETLSDGLGIFRTRVSKRADGSIDWQHTLCQMWVESIHRTRERRLLALEEDKESDEEAESTAEDEIEEDWTPEDIASYIYGAFTNYAWGIHRGRWLTALANCKIRWHEKKSNQYIELIVQNGFYHFVNNTEEFQSNTATNTIIKNRFAIADLKTYDRMRVLFSELRRLLQDSKDVTLYLDSHRQLSSRQIKKFLFPGDFDEED